jgi:hypothetical protein
MLNVIIKERVSGLEIKTMDTDTICITDVVLGEELLPFLTRPSSENGFYEELSY